VQRDREVQRVQPDVFLGELLIFRHGRLAPS
jgi:hypothetical protein